uniref:C2 domain-containing protein n=1 Tax=Sinocyclocheilus grahami TaxID=75366 RepID=A0A672QN40_SINGR
VIFCTKSKMYWKFPFYGEDFYFEIPRPFQCLSFYVYAKSMFQIRGLAVGKVAIRKEDLYKYCGKENWFQLQPVDPHSEVQVSERLDGIEVIILIHKHTPNRAIHEYTTLLPFCG